MIGKNILRQTLLVPRYGERLLLPRFMADSSKKPPNDDDIKIDLNELNKKLESSLKSGDIPKTDVDDKFMSFRRQREVNITKFCINYIVINF